MFNISVEYTPGGPSGEQQDIRLVSLVKEITLASCLSSGDLSSCLVNPNLPQSTKTRLQFSRNESNPWFDIGINITNAVVADSSMYTMILEAEDLSASGVVIQSTSIVNVVVATTQRKFVEPLLFSYQIVFLT